MKLTLRPLVVLICVGALVGVWALWSNAPRAARPTSGQGIVVFGDSLVAGRGASAGQDFVSVLSRRLGTTIVNAGQSGDTTGAALARLERDVLALNPRIVVVLLGGNDYLRRVPITQTFSNLDSIVNQVRERGAAVVLVGVAVGLMSDPYREEYEALAERRSAGLVPDILDGIIGHASLMSDSIHPNARGYAMMADRLEPILRDLTRPE
jgi:acyl-CoA thioesterase I